MAQAVVRLVLALSACTICGSQQITPNPAYAPTGGNVTLTCEHPQYPDADIKWIRGGIGTHSSSSSSYSTSSALNNDPRFMGIGSELFIGQFNASELAGEYSCLLNISEEGMLYEGAVLLSCPAQVQHARISSGFSVQPEDTTVVEGTMVILRCSPHLSVPAAIVSWTHNGRVLDPSTHHHRLRIAPLGNLYVLQAQQSDAGTYQCIASNGITGAMRRSDEIMLTVNAVTKDTAGVEPFLVVEPPEQAEGIEGSSLTLECGGNGYPKHIQSWSKEHEEEFPQETCIEETGELVFRALTPSHAGTYVCKILTQNHTLIITKEVALTVRVPPHLTATPPSHSTIQRGETISCSATASDSLQLHLLHNGSVLQSAIGRAVMVQLSLPTPDGLAGPTHLFQCMASNPIGCDNAEFTVVVSNEATPTTLETTPTNSPETTPSDTPETTPIDTTQATPTTSVRHPMLDLLATSPLIRGSIGERRTASCEVTGPADLELVITWMKDINANNNNDNNNNSVTGAHNLTSEPLDGITVLTQQQVDGALKSILEFQSIQVEHSGSYACHASIIGYDVHLEATITLVVMEMVTTETTDVETTTTTTSTTATTREVVPSETPGNTTPPLTAPTTPEGHVAATSQTAATTVATSRATTATPPTTTFMRTNAVPINLRIRKNPLTYDLEVSWEAPPTPIHPPVLGYKINWYTESGFHHAAPRDSVQARSSNVIVGGEYVYIIRGGTYDRTRPVTIVVWLYNINGDSLRQLISTEATTESLPTTTAGTEATTESLPTTTAATAATTETLSQCEPRPLNPTIIAINWPESFLADNSAFNVVVSCSQARSQLFIDSVTVESGDNTPFFFEQALPGCSYTIELYSAGKTARCKIHMPSGQVDLRASVSRFHNGTVHLSWRIPPELTNSEVTIDWGEGPVPLVPDTHVLVDFDPITNYSTVIRLRQADWEGILYVVIPPIPSSEESEDSTPAGQLALVYSVIFCSVVVACAILVAIILILKYVQWSRRDNDKVTNFREKSREEFERLSAKRSSINSIKSSKSTDV